MKPRTISTNSGGRRHVLQTHENCIFEPFPNLETEIHLHRPDLFMYFLQSADPVRFFSREMSKTVSTLTSQTVETVSKNVDSSLSVISKASTYLLGTTEVQNYLQDVNHAEYAILSKQLRNSLYLSMESMPLASSILVMRPSGTYGGRPATLCPPSRWNPRRMRPGMRNSAQGRGLPC